MLEFDFLDFYEAENNFEWRNSSKISIRIKLKCYRWKMGGKATRRSNYFKKKLLWSISTSKLMPLKNFVISRSRYYAYWSVSGEILPEHARGEFDAIEGSDRGFWRLETKKNWWGRCPNFPIVQNSWTYAENKNFNLIWNLFCTFYSKWFYLSWSIILIIKIMMRWKYLSYFDCWELFKKGISVINLIIIHFRKYNGMRMFHQLF